MKRGWRSAIDRCASHTPRVRLPLGSTTRMPLPLRAGAIEVVPEHRRGRSGAVQRRGGGELRRHASGRCRRMPAGRCGRAACWRAGPSSSFKRSVGRRSTAARRKRRDRCACRARAVARGPRRRRAGRSARARRHRRPRERARSGGAAQLAIERLVAGHDDASRANAVATARAARPIRARSRSSRSSVTRASTPASSSPSSNSRPLTPSRTSSGSPPTRGATVGTPHAAASSAARQKLSLRLVMSSTSVCGQDRVRGRSAVRGARRCRRRPRRVTIASTASLPSPAPTSHSSASTRRRAAAKIRAIASGCLTGRRLDTCAIRAGPAAHRARAGRKRGRSTKFGRTIGARCRPNSSTASPAKLCDTVVSASARVEQRGDLRAPARDRGRRR